MLDTADATKEECKEGYSIQLDGVRRKWNRQGSNPPLAQTAGYSLLSFPGRTTFVNTLCGKKVLHAKEADDAASAHLEEGVRIKPVTVGEQSTVKHSTWPQADANQSSSWTRKAHVYL